jgi:hypothetical protein
LSLTLGSRRRTRRMQAQWAAAAAAAAAAVSLSTSVCAFTRSCSAPGCGSMLHVRATCCVMCHIQHAASSATGWPLDGRWMAVQLWLNCLQLSAATMAELVCVQGVIHVHICTLRCYIALLPTTRNRLPQPFIYLSYSMSRFVLVTHRECQAWHAAAAL